MSAAKCPFCSIQVLRFCTSSAAHLPVSSLLVWECNPLKFGWSLWCCQINSVTQSQFRDKLSEGGFDLTVKALSWWEAGCCCFVLAAEMCWLFWMIRNKGYGPVSVCLSLPLPPSACFSASGPAYKAVSFDKVSARCFPFTTTLLCLSELEAVTQETRKKKTLREVTEAPCGVRYKMMSCQPLLNITFRDQWLVSKQRVARYSDDSSFASIPSLFSVYLFLLFRSCKLS